MGDIYTQEQFEAMLQSRALLTAAHFPAIVSVMLAGNVGLTLQALFTGSSFKMVRTYFQTRHDGVWARIGIMWITFVLVFCVVTGNVQQSMVIVYHEQFTAWHYQDFFVFQLQMLFNATLYAPILSFFVRRVYHIWDRRRIVLIAGYAVVWTSFVMAVIASAFGLRTPWGGFGLKTNDEYMQGIPAFGELLQLYSRLQLASEVMQTLTTGSLCFLTCYGIARHRNGYKTFDSAVSRIAFLSTEALVPPLLLNITSLTLHAGRFDSESVLILRPLASLAPAVFAWALLSALTSQERVRDILQAEPVRQLEPVAITAHAPDDYYPSEASKEGRDMRLTPLPVLESRNWARGGRGTSRAKAPAALRSETEKLYDTSQQSAPLSPGGGTSTANSLGIVVAHAPEGTIASPRSRSRSPDPLMRDGAIIRPPLSATAHRTEFRSSSPSFPSMLDSWRREQAAIKRDMASAATAGIGGRLWSRSAGEVPPPSHPAFGTAPIRQDSQLPTRASVDRTDDGMDIFEMLGGGPPPGRGRK